MSATLTRAEVWLLVVAGLSVDEPMSRPPKVKPMSAKRSLVLASPEMSRLQGWFERFIREDEHGCWIWHGARFSSGYGACGFRGTTTVAHRAIWQALYADLPRNVDLDHLCRVRACANPDHLEPVTRSMNLMRGAHPTQGRLGRRVA